MLLSSAMIMPIIDQKGLEALEAASAQQATATSSEVKNNTLLEFACLGVTDTACFDVANLSVALSDIRLLSWK